MSKMIFTVACLCLLSNCVAGQSANEQDVLDAFTDVYDIMYSIRDDHANQIQELRENQAKQIQELKDNQTKQIQELRDNDFEKSDEIKFLKLQIEELKKLTAPATCSELFNQDITRNQEVFLDTDGFNYGEKPVKAFCSFPSNVTFGEEKQSNVTFGEENHVNITNCDGPECFQSDFEINNSTLNQMKNVIETSTYCSQRWVFKCKSASLKQPVSLVFTYLHKLLYLCIEFSLSNRNPDLKKYASIFYCFPLNTVAIR